MGTDLPAFRRLATVPLAPFLRPVWRAFFLLLPGTLLGTLLLFHPPFPSGGNRTPGSFERPLRELDRAFLADGAGTGPFLPSLHPGWAIRCFHETPYEGELNGRTGTSLACHHGENLLSNVNAVPDMKDEALVLPVPAPDLSRSFRRKIRYRPVLPDHRTPPPRP